MLSFLRPQNILRFSLLALALPIGMTGCLESSGDNGVPAVQNVPRYWVAERGLDQVVAMTDSGGVLASVPVGHLPSQFAPSNDGLWVANAGAGTVQMIDLTAKRVVKTVRAGNDPEVIALVNNNLYVGNAGDNTVTVIDEKSASVVATIALAGKPVSISCAGGDNTVFIGEASGLVEVVLDPQYRVAGSFHANGTLAGVTAVSDVSNHHYAYVVTDNGAVEMLSGANGNYQAGQSFTVTGGSMVTHGDGGDVLLLNQGAEHFDEVAAGDNRVDTTATGPTGQQPQGAAQDWNTQFWVVADAASDALTIERPSAFGGPQTIQLPPNSHPYDVFVDTMPAGGSSVSTPAPAASVTPTPRATATPTPGAVNNTTLYVLNGSGGNVLTFAAPQSASETPTSIAMAGGTAGTSVATDGRGTMAVSANSNIYLYNGAISPASAAYATIYTGNPNFRSTAKATCLQRRSARRFISTPNRLRPANSLRSFGTAVRLPG